MFEGLEQERLHGALEALLFVSDEPVSTAVLADMVELSIAEVQLALQEMAAGYEQQARGIWLREVAGGWRLFTQPEYHALIEKYVVSWDTRRLSPAALETLAVVAYMQPVTRSAIASIRGVNSDSSLNSLVDKGLVREAGTADAPGNPMQYATTRVFLERFGLKSVADLPDVSQFAPDDETRGLICERLSIAHSDDYPGQEALFDEMEDGGARAAEVPDALEGASPANEALRAAFAGVLGTTEKIDFDKLVFDTDDE